MKDSCFSDALNAYEEGDSCCKLKATCLIHVYQYHGRSISTLLVRAACRVIS